MKRQDEEPSIHFYLLVDWYLHRNSWDTQGVSCFPPSRPSGHSWDLKWSRETRWVGWVLPVGFVSFHMDDLYEIHLTTVQCHIEVSRPDSSLGERLHLSLSLFASFMTAQWPFSFTHLHDLSHESNQSGQQCEFVACNKLGKFHSIHLLIWARECISRSLDHPSHMPCVKQCFLICLWCLVLHQPGGDGELRHSVQRERRGEEESEMTRRDEGESYTCQVVNRGKTSCQCLLPDETSCSCLVG